MSECLPILRIDGEDIPVSPHPVHEWTMPTANVARGYGVSLNAIRQHKSRHTGELIEGKHFFTTLSSSVTDCHSREKDANLTTEQTHWTKRGVIRLGFFLRSERAKHFRDAAEDLVLSHVEQRPALPPPPPPTIVVLPAPVPNPFRDSEELAQARERIAVLEFKQRMTDARLRALANGIVPFSLNPNQHGRPGVLHPPCVTPEQYWAGTGLDPNNHGGRQGRNGTFPKRRG